MRIIFVRHAEPDYEHHTLTKKGFREAEILSNRTAGWKVDKVYCSPMERAQYTARPCLDKWGMEATTYDWLEEIYHRVKDPFTGEERIAWDFYPKYFTGEEILHDKDSWYDHDVMKTGNIKDVYKRVVDGLNALLLDHGYEAKGNGLFEVKKHSDETIVIFCHLGVTFAMISYLTGIAAPTLWQGFFVAPTSITVLSTDERDEKNGVIFRVQTFGDASHLRQAGEPISQSGYFNEIFQN